MTCTPSIQYPSATASSNHSGLQPQSSLSAVLNPPLSLSLSSLINARLLSITRLTDPHPPELCLRCSTRHDFFKPVTLKSRISQRRPRLLPVLSLELLLGGGGAGGGAARPLLELRANLLDALPVDVGASGFAAASGVAPLTAKALAGTSVDAPGVCRPCEALWWGGGGVRDLAGTT